MKNPFLVSLITALLIWAAGTLPSAATTYEVEGAQPGYLSVFTDRGINSHATTLMLRGVDNGIEPQVDKVSCDGRDLLSLSKGQWQVPAGCRKLGWRVPLENSGASLPTAQRSLQLESGILFSEASSLPRLADAAKPEYLKFPAGRLFPYAVNGKIQLPDAGKPFLFAVFGEVPLLEKTGEKIGLFYLLDRQSAKGKIADMNRHLAGLQWLRSRLHKTAFENFAVLWLGVPPELLTLSGQTGSGLLLANYGYGDAKEPFGSAMRLYVPLHEAVHQIAGSDPRRPTWYDESLASYMAARATISVTDNDSGAVAMFHRFIADGSRFDTGLIALDEHIAQTGDVSVMPAFYTKGVAFWDAVNTALKARGESLDVYLATLALTRETENSRLPDFIQSTLHLPDDIWAQLLRAYLVSG